MTKKVSEKAPDELGNEFLRIIEKAVKSQKSDFSDDEITTAMKKVLPEIDEMISKNVKRHLVELANYIIEKMKEGE